MEYVCVSKTHFVHAHKLAVEENHHLLDKKENPFIKMQEGDREAMEIREHGPMCAVYDCSLLEDEDAVAALTAYDKLNANIQFSEDEMQAFARTDAMMGRTLAHSQVVGGTVTTIPGVIASIEASGLGQFSENELKCQ